MLKIKKSAIVIYNRRVKFLDFLTYILFKSKYQFGAHSHNLYSTGELRNV